MNQGNEASSSNPSRPDNSKAVAESVDFLLNESKQLRGEVHCGKSLQTLIFYSRVICTAFEAVKIMVHKFNSVDPSLEEAERIANCCKEACDVNKEIILMLSNVIQTSSSTSNTGGGFKKVLTWKKQCDKNIERIELSIKDAFSKEFYTWFDAFAFHGMFHGFAGVLASLYNILTFKETSDDQNLKSFAEAILETFEKTYSDIVCEEKNKIIRGMKHQQDQLLEESNPRNSPKEEEEEEVEEEEEALEKLQDDDTVKGFQEQTAVTQKNDIQEEEMCQTIIQEEEVQKNSKEAESNKKLQEAEYHEKSQEYEALKKIKGEEALKEEEEALNELQIVESQKKLQKDKETKNLAEEEEFMNLQEVDTQTKNLAEEEALKNLQEEDTQKKEEEEEALKKLQEEETQENSQEREITRKLQEEEEALKKSQEEENTGHEIFKFGHLTFKMKNGALERVLE